MDTTPDSTEYQPSDLDIEQWGPLSTQETVNQLHHVARMYVDDLNNDPLFATQELDEALLTRLAEKIAYDVPFYFQGSGVSTLPRQLNLFQSMQEAYKDGFLPEDARRTLMQGLDCKLPTVLLGFVIQEFVQRKGQAVIITLVQTGQSGVHPSLVVNIPCGLSSKLDENAQQIHNVVKVDFETKTHTHPPKTPDRKLLSPAEFREYTTSYAKVVKINTEEQHRYTQYPFIQHQLNALGLIAFDRAFIQS